MADEKDILEQLVDARMASKKELDKLDIQRNNRAMTGLSKNNPISSSMMPEEELARRISNAPTIDDLAAKPGSRVASKTEKSLLGNIGKKIGGKGLGKVAAGLAGLPLLLASEAADASELGESAEDDNLMIAEAQARKDYRNSPARADKLAASGQNPPIQSNDDYFKELRSSVLKRNDTVSDRLKNNGDQEIRDMVDVKESAMDLSEQGLSRDDKETIASDYAKKQREKRGLNPSTIPNINQGKKL